MDIRVLLIELAEKVGLICTAGLVSVLVPPLRNRLLGLGQPRDRLVGVLLGIALAMWGAKMGEHWLGHHVNVRAIGVLIAAVLGGSRGGVLAGLAAGVFYVFRVEPADGFWSVAASMVEGGLAGTIADRKPIHFQGWRAFGTATAVQMLSMLVLGIGRATRGGFPDYASAWPALLLQVLVSASGLTIFVVVARVVLSREEAAVALVEARAAADALELSALRSRLEPHFLFNALNTLRATIRTDPTQARELVSDLADLYRYLLNHPEDARLADEVGHACSYLAIERARLGRGRLEVETAVEADVADFRVPALLLQPLVENAVKHGVAAHDGQGMVRVVARREGDRLRVEVHNRNGGQPLGKVEAGSGIALTTLRERLAKRYAGAASLELVPDADGMRAVVGIPWEPLSPTPPERRSAA